MIKKQGKNGHNKANKELVHVQIPQQQKKSWEYKKLAIDFFELIFVTLVKIQQKNLFC